MSSPIRRILIADDHQPILWGLRDLLEKRPNLQLVAEAVDGCSALEEAARTKPDIAIIDYSLPCMNGLDLTLALKRKLPRIEVLMYTMHDREGLILDVLRAGARGYVLKSDEERNLLAALDALVLHRPHFSPAVSERLLQRFLNSSNAAPETLTLREREIVQLIAEGRINKEIAHRLRISTKTVETHRAAAMHKLKFQTTAQLVRYAVRNTSSRLSSVVASQPGMTVIGCIKARYGAWLATACTRRCRSALILRTCSTAFRTCSKAAMRRYRLRLSGILSQTSRPGRQRPGLFFLAPFVGWFDELPP